MIYLLLPLPLRSFQSLLLERAARLIRARRINRLCALLYVTDYTALVYDECGAASNEVLFVEDSISSNDLPLDVGEKRESNTYIFLESLIGGIAVNANAQNLRVALLKVGDIRLIRLQLFRSTTRKGENVEGQGHVLFASKIREMD